MRRIVTGHNESGKSIVILDGPPGKRQITRANKSANQKLLQEIISCIVLSMYSNTHIVIFFFTIP